MIEAIQRLLTPPQLDNDLDARLARLLFALALITLTSSLTFLIFSLLLDISTTTLGYQILFGTIIHCVGLLWLLKTGRVEGAKWLYLVFLVVTLYIGSWITGGISSVVYTGYILFVLAVCLMMGWRLGVAAAAFSILLGASFIQATAAGFIEPQEFQSFRFFVIFSVFLLAVPLIVRQTMNDLMQSQIAILSRDHELAAFFNTTREAVFILNLDGSYRFANESAAELLGYTVEEVVQMSNTEVVYPTDIDASNNVLHCLIYDLPHEQPYERVLKHRNGKAIPVEISSQLVKDGSNRPSYIQSMVRDITNRKANEERKLSEERARLEIEKEREILDQKTRFVTVASHNFRSPLSAIKLSAEFLLAHGDRLPLEKRQQKLERINSEIYRMSQLINDVLTISDGLSGEIELNLKKVHLPTFTEVVSAQLIGRYRKQATFSLKDDLTTEEAYFDDSRIMEAIHILVENGIRYSKPDVESEILTHVYNDDAYVYFLLSDNGIGIEDKDQKRIFNPFHRAGQVVNLEGSGLGLTIAQIYLQAHGGELSVESTAGEGSTFIAKLPLRPAELSTPHPVQLNVDPHGLTSQSKSESAQNGKAA